MNSERIQNLHLQKVKGIRCYQDEEMPFGCLIFNFHVSHTAWAGLELEIADLIVAQSSWEIIPLSTQIQVSKKSHTK